MGLKSPEHIKIIMDRFSQCTHPERLEKLLKAGFLTPEDVDVLGSACSLGYDNAEHLIENAIGVFDIPLGLAVHFVINKKDYVIPLAIEETSVIAAASKTAKWIRDHGELTAKNISWSGTGQIQFPFVRDFTIFSKKIEENKAKLLDLVNREVAHNMVLRGGGAHDLVVREIRRPDGRSMAVIHLMIDTCDAMGANIINQACEFLKHPIEDIVCEKAGLCILSNLADHKITIAKAVIKGIDPAEGYAIEEASLFASLDPWRAATNNKGVMNAIDGLLIATGNDWRAVEAGVHSYAARSGQYTSLTRWHMIDGDLHGELEAPIDVGIVGGVTRIHPMARFCLKILHVSSAKDLAEIVAAVGLVENLAALRALATEGITRGHMMLHVTNLLLAHGATKEEILLLTETLANHIAIHKKITSQYVKQILISSRKKA